MVAENWSIWRKTPSTFKSLAQVRLEPRAEYKLDLLSHSIDFPFQNLRRCAKGVLSTLNMAVEKIWTSSHFSVMVSCSSASAISFRLTTDHTWRGRPSRCVRTQNPSSLLVAWASTAATWIQQPSMRNTSNRHCPTSLRMEKGGLHFSGLVLTLRGC